MSLASLSSPLEVTVTPCQSSFFAGEELRCLITFTNRNIPIPSSQPLPSTSRFPGSMERRTLSELDLAQRHSKSHSFHMLSPHSRDGQQRQIKSNGAREITGTGSRAGKASPTALDCDLAGNVLPTRKRVIGKNALPASVQVSSAKATPERKHSKSFSMAVYTPSPSSQSAEHDARNHDNSKSTIGMGYPSGSASKIPVGDTSSPSRSMSGPSDILSLRNATRRLSIGLQADHPHSRKKSVIQVQHEDLSAAFELSNGTSTPSPGATGGNGTLSPKSSVPTASYDGDISLPGAYRMSPAQSTDTPDSEAAFYKLGRNDTMESVVRDQLTNWSRGAAPPSRRTSVSSTLNTNHVSHLNTAPSPLFPQRGTAAPGTESILWSFAQFSGSYEVDESLIKPGEFEDVKRRLAFGDGASSAHPSGALGAMGGGDLGHDESAEAAAATGWAAYLRGALGAAGAASAGASTAPSRHRRTGSTMLEARQKTMASKTIPIFSSPPSIIAVDLNLAAGESKTYSFTIQLPTDLPPSYFGKAIKFTYELVIGTNRVDARKTANQAGKQHSRLIKIPLRIYNHVTIAGVRPFFDLTNPVVLLRDAAVVKEEKKDIEAKEKHHDGKDMVRCVSTDSAHGRKRVEEERNRQDLQLYARSLLASCESPKDSSASLEKGRVSYLVSPPVRLRQLDGANSFDASVIVPPRRSSNVSAAGESEGAETCKGAIEVLTRNSQKVSYDISKDGEVAAVLTLVKSKYRLGDSILGVVKINQKGAVARVVRTAAVLESYEEVEATLGTMPAGRMQRATRKTHAEHHDSTLDVGQVSFSLPIPSGATPDFSTSGVKLHWTVRLSFLSQIAEPLSQGFARPVPPPHLYPTPDEDGFSLYHARYRAVPRLCGDFGAYFPQSSLEVTGDDSGEEHDTGKGSGAQLFGRYTKLEIVECAVPVIVLPNSTSFKPSPVTFAA